MTALADALGRAKSPASIAAATTALRDARNKETPPSLPPDATYQIVATNSPMMARKEIDLSLLTSASESLVFTSGPTHISFCGAHTIEWSDGVLGGQPTRLGLVSDLRLDGAWMETRASHFYLAGREAAQPPRILDFVMPGQATVPTERVEVVWSDGDHLVSQWRGFMTVARRLPASAPARIDRKLSYATFLVGHWRVTGGGWQGAAHCEPHLGGDWLRLDTYMTHDQLGVYNAHCLIGEQAGISVCHKYFEGGATFLGTLQKRDGEGSLCWVGERSVPGQPAVQQRTSYIRRDDGRMQILGEVQRPGRGWVTIADLEAYRS